jgi:hypothetical protein
MFWTKYTSIVNLVTFNSFTHTCQSLVGYHEVRRVRDRALRHVDLASMSVPDLLECTEVIREIGPGVYRDTPQFATNRKPS